MEGTIRQQVGTKRAAAVQQTAVPTIQALPVMSELQVSAEVELDLKYLKIYRNVSNVK